MYYFRTNPVTNNNEISQEILNNIKETIEYSDINCTDEEKNVDHLFDNALNDVIVKEKENIVSL